MLNRCMERIQELPYQVTLRWLFYRVMGQEAFGKKTYKDFKGWTSKARKNFWNGWRPDLLPDDGRKIHYAGGGYSDPKEWVESLLDRSCTLEKFSSQRNIVLVAFEAQAMLRQFEYYADPYFVTLIPFSGDAGIDHKWNIAKRIEALAETYPSIAYVATWGDYISPFG